MGLYSRVGFQADRVNVVSFTTKIFAFWRQFASVLFLRAVQEGASFIEACSRSDNAFIVLVAHCEQRGLAGVISQSLDRWPVL